MSVLDELVAGALQDQRTREQAMPLDAVKQAAAAAPAPLTPADGFVMPMPCPSSPRSNAPRRPRGILADIPDPAALAAEYERGGAAAISVLTEGRPVPRFAG